MRAEPPKISQQKLSTLKLYIFYFFYKQIKNNNNRDIYYGKTFSLAVAALKLFTYPLRSQ